MATDGVMAGVKVVFLDIDDTLYSPTSGLGTRITANIEAYLTNALGVPAADAPAARENYQKHGTTLAGLIAEDMAAFSIDAYIAAVYGGVPYSELLKPDPKLKALLESLSAKRRVFAFSNAHKEHVLAVLQAVGAPLACFEGFVEARGMMFANLKPTPSAYKKALQACGDCEPREALLIDDNFDNVEAARDFGMQAVHVSNEKDAFCGSEGCMEHQSRTASPRNSKVAQSCMQTVTDLSVAYPDLLA